MLVEFSVANFRSFREKVTLSMDAEPRLSERDKSVDTRNVSSMPVGEILRVAGVYGANASGKSNLIAALRTLQGLVLHSARGQAGDQLPAVAFRLDPEWAQAPVELEIVYITPERQVRFGVAFQTERVVREWLYSLRHGDTEESLCFERRWDDAAGKDEYSYGPEWQANPDRQAATRKEALHLSTASQLNYPPAQKIVAWFQSLRVVSGLTDTGLQMETARDLADTQHSAAIRELIRQMHVGVDDVQALPLPDEMVQLLHSATEGLRVALKLGGSPPLPSHEIVLSRRGVPFKLSEESAGTERVVSLAGPIVKALAEGVPMVIDEFDARLHTLLARQIVELFQDPSINRHNAQLIFASHDTNLLSRTLLRRDQLWFVEKSPLSQASDLYSLAELRVDGKKVRNDARYEEDYIQGRYGAIPFFGGLKRLLAELMGEP